ncbi:metal-dependent phosphoesterase [Candidatus Woesearchaeota archaeon]|nr:MAG: metal-dependent phosphoesterase [Candidatus Woesearchaeota archaeon]
MRYDLHIHTKYSRCSALQPARILKIAKKKKLDGIAITDHNTVRGALAVNKLNKDPDFEVVVGSEMKSEYGDVLIYYQNEEIKTRNFLELIDAVKQQGAMLAVAHPFRIVPWLKFKLPLKNLVGKVDAVETFNSRNAFWSNTIATKEAKKYGFAGVGGSDAHWPFDIGNGYTIFRDNLIKAIKTKQTEVGGTTYMVGLSAILSTVQSRIIYPIFS